jgi:hypothetical protein
VVTFLVIFAGFLGSLYMTFVGEPGVPAATAAAPPNADDIEANAEAAAEYRESVGAAYGNAAAEMDSIAAQIAGEEAPADEPASEKD